MYTAHLRGISKGESVARARLRARRGHRERGPNSDSHREGQAL